jgi:CPA2 family monovalent cation:H+ antiporter-2
MPVFVVTVVVLALLGITMKIVRQPLLIGYVLAGLMLGPYGLGFIADTQTMSRIGAIGVILLLFFIGIAVSPSDLRSNWKVAIGGTFLQISCSTLAVIGIGELFDWPIARSVLLGFVISMSSTAIVMKLLEDGNLLETPLGHDAFSITLVQDLAVVPMILVMSALAGEKISQQTLMLQIVAGLAFVLIIFWLSKPRVIKLPFGNLIKKDHELQVLLTIAFCFGVALISALMGLSSAFGAFLAGVSLRVFRETHWLETSLSGFRIILVALFFASVGMLLDLGFIRDNWAEVAWLSFVVIVANTCIVTVILIVLGRTWRHSLQVGAMLSQIGEFSFVLAAIGIASGVIVEFSYNMTISIIVITLTICPLWISLIRRVCRISEMA